MRQKDLVIIFGSSCVLVVLWIIFTLINKSATSTINEVNLAAIKPITASFDTETLEKAKSKLQVVPAYSLGTATSADPLATPSPNITATLPIPSPSIGVNTATNSAGVQP